MLTGSKDEVYVGEDQRKRAATNPPDERVPVERNEIWKRLHLILSVFLVANVDGTPWILVLGQGDLASELVRADLSGPTNEGQPFIVAGGVGHDEIDVSIDVLENLQERTEVVVYILDSDKVELTNYRAL